MQFKVPQNIDIQDRVIGPLTLKQFLYVIAGGAVILVLKFSLPGFLGIAFFPLAMIAAGIFGTLAFYEPEGRPFEGYLFSVLSTVTRPRKRIWKKEIIVDKKETKKEEKTEKVEKNVSGNDLEKLAFIVDSGGFSDELKSKGIIAAINPNIKSEPLSDLSDSLEASEKPNKEVRNLLENAKKKIEEKRTEPTVQSMATIDPDKNFKYEKLAE